MSHHFLTSQLAACAFRQIVQFMLSVSLCLSFASLNGSFGAAYAQSPDKILKQALKVMGGEKAVRAVKSWQAKGEVTRLSDGAQGKYLAFAQAPNLFSSSYDLAGFEIATGFNGKSSWQRDSREGLRTLTGLASRDFAVEAAYRNARWLDAKRDKSKLTLAESAQINGKTALAVLYSSSKGTKLKLWFEQATGQLVREEIPFGDEIRQFDYSDFRKVNALLEPHVIQVTAGKERYEIKLSEITHNLPFERARFEFPKLSNDALPNVETLLKEVKANEERIDEILENYTYTENVTRREIDKQGQMQVKESETFELTFYQGNRIRRLIAKNGKPLSADEQREEQKRVEKRVRDLEKQQAEKEKKDSKERELGQSSAGPPDPERGKRPSIADVLRANQLVNPRRERFRGRDVVVFDFEPLPGYKPQKDSEKFFGKTAGAVWVDVKDKQVARVEARLIEAYKVAGGMVAKLSEGASFVLENDRINNEIWLPSKADINLAIRVLLVKGISVTSSITFGNYQRFNVESEKEKLKDPVSGATKPKP